MVVMILPPPQKRFWVKAQVILGKKLHLGRTIFQAAIGRHQTYTYYSENDKLYLQTQVIRRGVAKVLIDPKINLSRYY